MLKGPTFQFALTLYCLTVWNQSSLRRAQRNRCTAFAQAANGVADFETKNLGVSHLIIPGAPFPNMV